MGLGDSRPCRLCPFVNGICVGNNYVRTASRETTQVFGRFKTASKLVVLLRTEHDHSAVKRQFGVGDCAIWCRIHSMALKSKHIAKPLNGSRAHQHIAGPA